MTKHLADRPYIYSGICLENGLQVTTNKRKRYAALCRIIEKIINYTFLGEKAFAERYSSHPYKPFKDLKEELPNLEKQFTKRMEKALSLDEYVSVREKLKPLWEKPRFAPEDDKTIPFKTAVSLKISKFLAFLAFFSILLHSVPILYDCKEMGLALRRLKKNSRLCGATIKYRRI
jgi:hypothetical protein